MHYTQHQKSPQQSSLQALHSTPSHSSQAFRNYTQHQVTSAVKRSCTILNTKSHLSGQAFRHYTQRQVTSAVKPSGTILNTKSPQQSSLPALYSILSSQQSSLWALQSTASHLLLLASKPLGTILNTKSPQQSSLQVLQSTYTKSCHSSQAFRYYSQLTLSHVIAVKPSGTTVNLHQVMS